VIIDIRSTDQRCFSSSAEMGRSLLWISGRVKGPVVCFSKESTRAGWEPKNVYINFKVRCSLRGELGSQEIWGRPVETTPSRILEWDSEPWAR